MLAKEHTVHSGLSPPYRRDQLSLSPVHFQMTNGGGASEKDRSKRLTEQLGFEVSPIISLYPRLCCSKDYYLQFYAITHRFKVIYA